MEYGRTKVWQSIDSREAAYMGQVTTSFHVFNPYTGWVARDFVQIFKVPITMTLYIISTSSLYFCILKVLWSVSLFILKLINWHFCIAFKMTIIKHFQQ